VREIRLYDSLNGELVLVSPGDAIRVEVRTSPVLTAGTVDVGSTRPFVLFSFLERYLQREGFGTKFLFNSPSGGDGLYELAEREEIADAEDDPRPHAGGRAGAGEDGRDEAIGGMGLLPVSRSDVERWVNVCFGADRQGREWPPAAPSERVPLNDALKLFGHSAVAVYLLGTHYSQPLGDAHVGLQNGCRHAQRIREIAPTLVPGAASPADMRGHLEDFRAALADDLDTPTALVSTFEWVLEAERRGGVGDRDLRAMLAMFELDDLLAPVGGR
jgi:cysteinyl-tRNA synthetase